MKSFRCVAAMAAAFAMLFAAPLVVRAQSSQPLPPVFYAAENYSQWSLYGQTPNGFTWNSGCKAFPVNYGQQIPFFVFGSTAVPFPLLIRDAIPAQSEVVTPSSTGESGNSCTFSAATAYTHSTFWVSSGTGGLQEAVVTNAVAGSTVAVNIILDAYWRAQIAALPGSHTPASVIAAIKGGSTNVQLVDITTSPSWTTYTWNGTSYAAAAGQVGGVIVPTVTAGAGAGTTPTISDNGNGNVINVPLTTGTAPAAGVLYTLTWPTTGSFAYAPTCSVTSTGANALPALTWSTAYAAGHATLTVNATTAPAASTAYSFRASCS